MRLGDIQPHSDESPFGGSKPKLLRYELSNHKVATSDLETFGVQLYAVLARA